MSDVSRIGIYRVYDKEARAGLANKLTQVTTMPTSPSDGQVALYMGVDTDDYKAGTIYQYDATESKWVAKSAAGSIDVDSELSPTSENPVQNKVLTAALSLLDETKVEQVSELPSPTADNEGFIRLLIADQAGYEKGMIYQCQPNADSTDYEWVAISSSTLVAGKGITIGSDNSINADTNIFYGTKAEWEALSDEEQSKYSHVSTPETDGTSYLPPISTLDTSSPKAVNSSAVADALKSTPTLKNIAYAYQSATDLKGVIKEILDSQLPPATTPIGTYTGQCRSTHSGSGSMGSWSGHYEVTLSTNGNYGASGIVVAQGYQFTVRTNEIAGGWTVLSDTEETTGTATRLVGIGGTCVWRKVGKVVWVYVNGLNIPGDTASSTSLFSGLPAPYGGTAVLVDLADNQSIVINLGSTIQLGGLGLSHAGVTSDIWGSFSYIATN